VKSIMCFGIIVCFTAKAGKIEKCILFVSLCYKKNTSFSQTLAMLSFEHPLFSHWHKMSTVNNKAFGLFLNSNKSFIPPPFDNKNVVSEWARERGSA